MEIIKKYAGIFLNILTPLLITALIWFAGPKLLKFFMPFVIGMLIALAAAPLVRFLEKRVKLMRHFTSMLIIIGALALIVLAAWLILSRLVHEGIQLVQDAPALFESFSNEIRQTILGLENVLTMLPDSVRQGILNGLDNLSASVSDMTASLYSPAMEMAGSLARSIPNILVYTVVTLMSAYYFLADYDKLIAAAKTKMPDVFVWVVRFIRRKSGEIVGGYFLAQFRIMIVIAVILAVGLTMLKVSYSGLVAFLIAFLDFLPIFGTGTVLLPWALLKLLNGAYGTAVFLLILYGLTQLVRQLIQPKLLGASMGMDPFLTLLFLYIGYKLDGFTGMILSVPVGLILLEVVRLGAYDGLVDGVMTLYREGKTLMKQARSDKKQKGDAPETTDSENE